MTKSIPSHKGIEITKQNKSIAISQGGVEIYHKGKPISSKMMKSGFVYLVVDCSGSMEAGNKLDQAREGASRFAEKARVKGYSVGLIQFHSYPTHLCEPVSRTSILEEHLKNIEIGDSTHMAEGINLAHHKLRRKEGVRVMVIVTDGMPNGPGDPEASIKAGERAKREEIDIITIGTDDADQEFLRKLASRTELGVKVSRKQFGKALTSTAKMLPQLGEP